MTNLNGNKTKTGDMQAILAKKATAMGEVIKALQALPHRDAMVTVMAHLSVETLVELSARLTSGEPPPTEEEAIRMMAGRFLQALMRRKMTISFDGPFDETLTVRMAGQALWEAR